MLAAYTIPRIDVQVAGTVQSIPGPVVLANVVYPAATLAPALGRPFVGGATAVVNVIPTAAEYGDRLNQLDFRVGKLLRDRRAAHRAERRSVQRVQRQCRADGESRTSPSFRQPT